MTEQRAIDLLKGILPKKVSYAQMICASNCYGDEMVYQEPEPYAIEFAINSIQENSKLKAENEEYKKETSQDKIDYAYDLGYQSCLNYNGVRWKDAEEIQKLRREINQLKSEVEQSVKEKTEVISKIEYALNECEPIYNKCAVIPQAKPVYDLAMNYCLDLLKGQVPE